MSEPTLHDCINYMRSQIRQMEKHPRNYEFNLPYYRKTVELLERRKTNDETFEWCHDCKEYDQKNHCCHRWSKVVRDTVDELEKDRRPHGEWIEHRRYNPIGCFYSAYECSNCRDELWQMTEWQFCPNCGADMREEGDTNDR